MLGTKFLDSKIVENIIATVPHSFKASNNFGDHKRIYRKCFSSWKLTMIVKYKRSTEKNLLVQDRTTKKWKTIIKDLKNKRKWFQKRGNGLLFIKMAWYKWQIRLYL